MGNWPGDTNCCWGTDWALVHWAIPRLSWTLFLSLSRSYFNYSCFILVLYYFVSITKLFLSQPVSFASFFFNSPPCCVRGVSEKLQGTKLPAGVKPQGVPSLSHSLRVCDWLEENCQCAADIYTWQHQLHRHFEKLNSFNVIRGVNNQIKQNPGFRWWWHVCLYVFFCLLNFLHHFNYCHIVIWIVYVAMTETMQV